MSENGMSERIEGSLSLAPGEKVRVVPQLTSATGAALCGFPWMDVKSSGKAVAEQGEREQISLCANRVLIVSGAPGRLDFSVAGAVGSLGITAAQPGDEEAPK
jgi:hypothetical protein